MNTLDAARRRRLMLVMVVYEIAIISIIIAAGANIALGQGGTLAAAAPLIVIGLAESLRIPLAGWSTRLNLRGKALAWLALAAIALTSFDGLALVFSIFIDNRMADVLAAQHRVEIAEQATVQTADDISAFTAEVKEMDGQIGTLAGSTPQTPAASNRVCSGKKGARVTCNADAVAAATYQAAMKSYDARLAEFTAKRADLQKKVDAARVGKDATIALTEARRNLDDELQRSPMHKLAASLYGVRVAALTEDQFGAIKRFAIVGLAGCFATLSMLVGVVVHAQPRGVAPGKLKLALRGFIARLRRRLVVRRDVPGPVEFKERVRLVYVPVDERGRVLNPDAKQP